MKRYFFYIFASTLLISCKTQPNSNREYDAYDENRTYKLQLNPAGGSSYHYDISNETEMELEVNGKNITNITRSETGIDYKIEKDSAGDYLFQMTFDKVHLYTKNGETETSADAANAAVSINPLEKMLGILQNAHLEVSVSTKGDVFAIKGYKEIEDQVLVSFNFTDEYSKQLARTQWDKLIGEGIVKQNIDQLFKIFPDSLVHLGDTWRLNTRQEGEINMNVKSKLKLSAINKDIAIINSEAKLTSDKSSTTFTGMRSAVANLAGDQEGEFEMETKTGMLINCDIKSKIKGNILISGQEIPVTIKNTVKMKGTRKL